MGYVAYSEDDKNYLKSHFRTTRNVDMAKKLGRSADSIREKMKELSLKRTPEELSAIRKQPNAGQFKPGNKPSGTKYDGYERIEPDGYVHIRVSEGNFKLKHHVIWEKSNGSIPEGFNICFKDGNRQHTALENLELVSYAEMAKRNANREKQGKTLKRTWSRCFSLHQIGIHRAWYRNK